MPISTIFATQPADASGAFLVRANLKGADLRGANLFAADLSGASLWDADLRDALLAKTDLSGANLSDADLSRANLLDAYLVGADLSHASGLTQEQLDGACGDDTTQLPQGLTIRTCPVAAPPASPSPPIGSS
jgi:uncharacterized protein YjbI with pentapeptide repeats